MATRGGRQSGAPRSAPKQQGRPRGRDEEGIIPVLARAVRDVELAVQRGRVRPSTRVTFQVVALLVREERNRVKTAEGGETRRNEQLKRIDGIATILARTAARESSLLTLLAEDAELLDGARSLMREMQLAGGLEPTPEPVAAPEAASPSVRTERQVVPQSVVSRQLANPFLEPDFSVRAPAASRPRLLSTWELLGPLLRAFETASGGASSCMKLPEPRSLQAAGGRLLMPHQAQVVEAAAEGHRTFLLADEPGLGKTAQALLAAQAADAYPLLVVVPNVVKTNWAREVGLWTPSRTVTVVHGDGDNVDGFSDVVVVNYEVLDRHVGWLGDFG
ncbi:MAG: helicase, partial [Frankiales bacterium]|nr:helicase [Frankiales bacterium]